VRNDCGVVLAIARCSLLVCALRNGHLVALCEYVTCMLWVVDVVGGLKGE